MPRPLRVLIAADEPLARERQKRPLAAEPGIEAVAALGVHDPDLALLDVRRPLRDGFEVARAQPTHATRPLIGFVTAHESPASQAFGVQATDYS